MILGTLYFSVLEVIQFKTLKSQFLKSDNFIDIAYLVINFCFITDIFIGFIPEKTATNLSIAQVILMGIIFINWLRVFERTVIFIRLIKQTMIDMIPFAFLLFVVVGLSSFCILILNMTREKTDILYNEDIF